MDPNLVTETRDTALVPPPMGRGTVPRERTRNRAGKQEALLSAATKLFALRGYEATTTREIAAHAGCAEGLIHRYFNGKAGLLVALIQQRASREVVDLNQRLPLASNLEDEFLQLIAWEVERLWEDRDFLKVIIPRALLDPSFSKVMASFATARHTQAMVKRLRQFKPNQTMSNQELESLAQAIGVLGFAFGFVHPVILSQDRSKAQKMASQIGKVMVR